MTSVAARFAAKQLRIANVRMRRRNKCRNCALALRSRRIRRASIRSRDGSTNTYRGSETIEERGPVQAGGTIGVTPAELNTPATSWQAAAGDRIKLLIDETLGGTPTVDGIIILNPL